MENQKRPEQPTTAARKSLKRKLEEEFVEDRDEFCVAEQDLVREVEAQVEILNACRTSTEADRAAAKRAIHVVSEYAKIGTRFAEIDNLSRINLLKLSYL